jgi:hypothetical protein
LPKTPSNYTILTTTKEKLDVRIYHFELKISYPRVFGIDVETCSKCGGRMKIIAAIEDPKVIRKILDHMGLDTKPPQLMPARGPPMQQHHFEDDFNQQHFDLNFNNFNQFAD